MAPRTEFSTEQVRTKARKDLLYLLEGVSHSLLQLLRALGAFSGFNTRSSL